MLLCLCWLCSVSAGVVREEAVVEDTVVEASGAITRSSIVKREVVRADTAQDELVAKDTSNSAEQLEVLPEQQEVIQRARAARTIQTQLQAKTRTGAAVRANKLATFNRDDPNELYAACRAYMIQKGYYEKNPRNILQKCNSRINQGFCGRRDVEARMRGLTQAPFEIFMTGQPDCEFGDKTYVGTLPGFQDKAFTQVMRTCETRYCPDELIKGYPVNVGVTGRLRKITFNTTGPFWPEAPTTGDLCSLYVYSQTPRRKRLRTVQAGITEERAITEQMRQNSGGMDLYLHYLGESTSPTGRIMEREDIYDDDQLMWSGCDITPSNVEGYKYRILEKIDPDVRYPSTWLDFETENAKDPALAMEFPSIDMDIDPVRVKLLVEYDPRPEEYDPRQTRMLKIAYDQYHLGQPVGDVILEYGPVGGTKQTYDFAKERAGMGEDGKFEIRIPVDVRSKGEHEALITYTYYTAFKKTKATGSTQRITFKGATAGCRKNEICCKFVYHAESDRREYMCDTITEDHTSGTAPLVSLNLPFSDKSVNLWQPTMFGLTGKDGTCAPNSDDYVTVSVANHQERCYTFD